MKTLQEQYVIDTEGNKTAVILSLQRYEQLLEDLHDLAVVAERREEKCDLCLKHSWLVDGAHWGAENRSVSSAGNQAVGY
jgi:hypothetical protein